MVLTKKNSDTRKDFKTLYVRTTAPTEIVVRTAKGRKLFEMNLRGVSITVVTPPNSEITIRPTREKTCVPQRTETGEHTREEEVRNAKD